ncbi:sensor domain-containing phosphodiesterase [Sneathiella limimaris]|uniref:bifunctional diguanylate cyclase/phosphodiesterase n=1 Tax=Sneathiella limimaris TaxID=1964213 RepID=UPI0023FA30A0|nr:sensor domain-containing phosphodiesterase [Sneathiella limimaris]
MSSVRKFPSLEGKIIGSAPKTEKLLRALSQMQACRHTGSYYQTVLSELSALYPELDYCAFLAVSPDTGGITVTAKQGKVPNDLPKYQYALLKQALEDKSVIFTDNTAALCLSKGDKKLGAILLKSTRSWDGKDFKLLRQLAVNITNGLETVLLLEDVDESAYQDTLTILGNRGSFKKLVQKQIDRRGADQQFAVLHFVLDMLGELNIALGYSIGDEMICRAAEELVKLFPNAIALARTSGNGFGVCVKIENEDDYLALPQLIYNIFDKKLPDEFGLPHMTPAVGLTRFPIEGMTADKLWKNSATALASALKTGGKSYCFYDRQIEVEIHGRITLNKALREGMAKKQLFLNYQPQISLETGKMVGVEALLRWKTEAGEYVPADTFIPIAEASGLLGPISEWVIREACLQRMRWTAEGVPEFPVAVNISLNEFQSEDFVNLVRRILEETGLEPRFLDIELTESVIMEDRGQTKINMNLLKDMGVSLSIDDFGTGYSSLSYLSHLPASVIKIDKSFIDGILTNQSDAVIAKTIISLGYNLGMKILAEGVESQEQMEFLKEAGCHEAQGFNFSKAVTPSLIPGLAAKQDYLTSLH